MISGAYVLITNKCNFNCSYCYEKNRTGDMKWDTMKTLIDRMVDGWTPGKRSDLWSDLKLNLFGGEPMFNWKIVKKTFEYTEEVRKEKGIRFGITILTNGSIWNDEINEFLFKYKRKMGKRFKMQISLDGCEASHNINRPTVDGKDTFQLVVNNIKKYKQIIPDLQVRETLVPSRVDSFFEDYKTLSSLVDIVQMTPIIEDDWFPVLGKAKEELQKIYDLYFEQLKNNPYRFVSLLNSNVISSNDQGASTYTKIDYKGCHAGYELVGVTVNGDLYPCHRFIAYKDKFDFKMGDVWNGVDETLPAVKEIREAHISNEKCTNCTSYTCNRCYATNKFITGEIDASPSTGYCEFCAMNQELVNKVADKLFADYNNTLSPFSVYKSLTSKRRGIIMEKGEKVLGADAEDLMIQGMNVLLKTMHEIKHQNTKLITLLTKIVEQK